MTHGVGHLSCALPMEGGRRRREGRALSRIQCAHWSKVDLNLLFAVVVRQNIRVLAPSIQAQDSVCGLVWSGYCGHWDNLAGPTRNPSASLQVGQPCSLLCPPWLTRFPSGLRSNNPVTSV